MRVIENAQKWFLDAGIRASPLFSGRKRKHIRSRGKVVEKNLRSRCFAKGTVDSTFLCEAGTEKRSSGIFTLGKHRDYKMCTMRMNCFVLVVSTWLDAALRAREKILHFDMNCFCIASRSRMHQSVRGVRGIFVPLIRTCSLMRKKAFGCLEEFMQQKNVNLIEKQRELLRKKMAQTKAHRWVELAQRKRDLIEGILTWNVSNSMKAEWNEWIFLRAIRNGWIWSS